jgi:hypothetical protein
MCGYFMQDVGQQPYQRRAALPHAPARLDHSSRLKLFFASSDA